NTQLDGWGPADSYPEIAFSFVHPGFSTPSNWHKADPVRSAAVWQRLLEGDGMLDLSFSPSDLYSRTLEWPATLGCTEAVPRIRSMAVVFYLGPGWETLASNINSELWRANLEVANSLGFATTTGLETYVLDDQDWLFGRLRLLAVSPDSQQAIAV